MSKVRTSTSSSGQKRRIRPATNPESREQQMINLAVDLAEKQMLEGTASSQVITHFLKLGTEKAKLERVKLEKETELLTAKTESLESAKRMEELYEKAIKAMQNYAGHGDEDEYDDEYSDEYDYED